MGDKKKGEEKPDKGGKIFPFRPKKPPVKRNPKPRQPGHTRDD